MRGFIDRVDRNISKMTNSLQVMGRDMCQILHDSYVLGWDCYSNLSGYINMKMDVIIKDIWNKSKSVIGPLTLDPQHQNRQVLASPMSLPALRFFGVDHSITGYSRDDLLAQLPIQAQNFPTVTEFRTTPGESMYDAMSKLCNQYGYVIYNYPGTLQGQDVIIFHPAQAPNIPTSPEYMAGNGLIYTIFNTKTNSPVNNVKDVQFSSDITSYAKYLQLIGQCGDSLQFNPNETTFQSLSTSPQYLKVEKIEANDYGSDHSQWHGYRGLLKFKVIETNVPDTSIWYNEEHRQALLNNALLQQNRQLYNFRYTLAGLSPLEGFPAYQVNNLVNVYDDMIGIRSTFLVYRVELKGSKTGGLTTTLEMALPSGTSSELRVLSDFTPEQINNLSSVFEPPVRR
jgi:hypothetical protein